METHPHHRHINLLLIITILLLVILIIMIKPALLGYKISKQFEETGMSTSDFLKEFDSLKSKNLVSNTNLEDCKARNKDYLKDISDEREAGVKCMEENNKLKIENNQLARDYQSNLSNMNDEIEDLKLQLEDEKNKIGEIKESNDKIIQNSANNICCKAKVDNSDIDSYIISNDKIVCTTGEEDKVSC